MGLNGFRVLLLLIGGVDVDTNRPGGEDEHLDAV